MYCSLIYDLINGEVSTYETDSYLLNKEMYLEYQPSPISSNDKDSGFISLVGGGLAPSSYLLLFSYL